MWKKKLTAITLVMTMILCTGCLKGLFYKRSGNLADDLYQNHYRPEIASEIAEEIIAEAVEAAMINSLTAYSGLRKDCITIKILSYENNVVSIFSVF